MTAKVKKVDLPEWLADADLLRLYTPAQVIENGWLPHTEGYLKDLCYRKKVAHTKVGGRIMLNRWHVYLIQQAGEVDPATRGRVAA